MAMASSLSVRGGVGRFAVAAEEPILQAACPEIRPVAACFYSESEI